MQQLINDLKKLKNQSRIVTITTRTLAKTRGLTSPIEKEAKRNVIIGCDYSNVVEKRTGMRPLNVAGLWGGHGEHIEGTPLVKNRQTGELYLPVLMQSCTNVKYFVGGSNVVVEKDALGTHLVEPSDSAVAWRVIKLSNITDIKGL